MQYSLLLQPILLAGEGRQPYNFLTERHLQALWAEQKYFNNLSIPSGEEVQVISPGYWNCGPGPDFMKAHLKIGGKEYKGDVEIHLHEEDWANHSHHLDPRYQNVILHVALWQPRTQRKQASCHGKEIVCLYLQGQLKISQDKIIELIDLDLYPYKEFLGSGKCSQQLFNSLPEENIDSFFKSAAEWRLKEKRQFLKNKSKAANNPSEEFLLGFAGALGYKSNSEAFKQLYLSLSKQTKKMEDEKLALCMEACGFFSDSYQAKWGDSQKYRYLLSLAQRSTTSFPSVTLCLSQVRPFNHPIRRMVTLIKLLSSPEPLYDALIQCWNRSWHAPETKNKWRDFYQQLISHLPSYKDSYWSRHYLFENTIQPNPLPLLGDSTKTEIIINVFLPLLYDELLTYGDPRQLFAFDKFYGSLPSSYTGKTKYLIHRFFGDSPKKMLFKQAYVEQGAYQLHKDFCLHYEASCEGCNFVDKFKSLTIVDGII